MALIRFLARLFGPNDSPYGFVPKGMVRMVCLNPTGCASPFFLAGEDDAAAIRAHYAEWHPRHGRKAKKAAVTGQGLLFRSAAPL